jgi:predicted choloylglycine hydrolase
MPRRFTTPHSEQSAQAFKFIATDFTDPSWLNHYQHYASHYRTQFLHEGELKHPSLADCDNALREYMPGLHKTWQQLCQQTQADEIAARVLSGYAGEAMSAFNDEASLGSISGVQVVWNRYPNVLIRSAENPVQQAEHTMIMTQARDEATLRTLGSSGYLWGYLDGMNEAGLCLSWSALNSHESKPGFKAALVARYVLETCLNTAQAVEALHRIPIQEAVSFLLLDAFGQCRKIDLHPYSPPVVSIKPFLVQAYGSDSFNPKQIECEQSLMRHLYEPSFSLAALIRSFDYSPFFYHLNDANAGTLWTVIYNPALLACEYRWPHHPVVYQSFAHFDSHTQAVNFA